VNITELDPWQVMMYVVRFYLPYFVYALAIVIGIIAEEISTGHESAKPKPNDADVTTFTLKGKSLSLEEWQNLEWDVTESPDEEGVENISIDQILLLLDTSSPGS
jgi:hypothetical protein